MPFVTWAGQDAMFLALVGHVDKQKPLVIEKSRDAGASWALIYTADWLWRFHDHFHTGLSSRVGDLVDSKSPDSLFWKLRFVQKWLPTWLYPKGWSKNCDTEMHYENPETGSIVSGHPTTKDIGVAGRCGLFGFDEYARVPNARSVRDNTKDTADCRVFTSTHTSPGTDFAQLCTGGVVDKIVVHWTDHPEKRLGLYRYHPDKLPPYDVEIIDKEYPFPPDYPFVRDGTPSGGPHPCVRSPWYDQQCLERSRVDVRTNLDIDVAGSTSQFFDATLIRRLIAEFACDPEWVGDVKLTDDGRADLIGLETGPLKLWVGRNMKGEFRRSRYVVGIDVAAGTGATPSCLTVFDTIRRLKVAEYTNAFITPERFAVVAAALGRLFMDPGGFPAKVVWDKGGAVGKSFGQTFMRQGYSHVHYQLKPMSYAGVQEESDSPGWSGTSNELKATMLMEYASALEKRAYVNPSKVALEECLQFRWVEGRVEHATERNAVDDSAARESHADHVIADGLAWMLVENKEPPSDQPKPDPEPPPGSWEWRRLMGQRADEAQNDGWQS